MPDALQRDELPRMAQTVHRLLRDRERRDRIARTRDRHHRHRHGVDSGAVAAERREERLAGIRNVADDRRQARIGDNLPRRQADAHGELRAREQHHRLAAEARAEAADARRVHASAPVGIGQHDVDRARQRDRPNGLHRRVVVEMQQDVEEVAQVVDRDVGEARIAMERRDDDVAPAREHREPGDVVAGDGAAAQAVRVQQHRKARHRVGPDGRVAGAHHVRHGAAGRQDVSRCAGSPPTSARRRSASP